LVLFERYLRSVDVLDSESLDALREEVVMEVGEGVRAAEESPWPDPGNVTDNVFADPDPA
jgi:TPP-dependent pyruvate/acetoin dehydrogenase alpha subunit